MNDEKFEERFERCISHMAFNYEGSDEDYKKLHTFILAEKKRSYEEGKRDMATGKSKIVL